MPLMPLRQASHNFARDDTVPCNNRPFRCEHWDRCANEQLACPGFRAWVMRSRFPLMQRTPGDVWTPTREDYLRVFDPMEDTDDCASDAGGPAELASWRSPPPSLPERDAADDVLGDSPEDGRTAEQLAAAARLDPGLGAGHRQDTPDAWRKIVRRHDLR